ncbi:MAG: lysophospholipase [Candidatus Izimaplasma sp.]|nr:lysophospholipase [Candidatus Izimaplasma bacterium]
MGIDRFTVKGSKGINLSCYKIVPDGELKGVVHILHGMGEHKERYLHFSKYLAKNSFAVYVHDHRKHGESVSDVSEVGIFTKHDKWEDIIDDCNYVGRKIKKDYPNVKVITLGHSMGSVIGRKYISKYPNMTDAAIIMGTTPPISLGRAIVPLLMSSIMCLFNPKNNRSEFLSKLLNGPLIKDLESRKTDFDWISSDPAIVEKYVDDPLCGYAYSTRFYKEFFKGLLDASKSVTIFKTNELQFLFISGIGDPVGEFGEGVKAMREVYSGHGFLDLTLEIVKEARHEVLNEVNKEATYKFILEWIEKSLDKIEMELG